MCNRSLRAKRLGRPASSQLSMMLSVFALVAPGLRAQRQTFCRLHAVRYSFAMVAFCYCLSFAFDKAETSYSFSGNILNFAFMIPSLVVSIGSTTGLHFPAIHPFFAPPPASRFGPAGMDATTGAVPSWILPVHVVFAIISPPYAFAGSLQQAATAATTNAIQRFYSPATPLLAAQDYLADQRVLSAVIVMPVMTLVFIRLAIFLDGAGISVLKAKFAIWKRQRLQQSTTLDADVTMNALRTGAKSAEEVAAIDDDVAAEATRINSGRPDENAPIVLQDVTKTFVDESSGLEIKAVQGVSFEVPVSQVMTRGAAVQLSHAACLSFHAIRN
jgi:hypothetical protein